MKRVLTWILAVGLLAVAGLYLASVIWPPPGEGGPGEGLANREMRLSLADDGDKVARTGKTDADGKLLLEDLELGS